MLKKCFNKQNKKYTKQIQTEADLNRNENGCDWISIPDRDLQSYLESPGVLVLLTV